MPGEAGVTVVTMLVCFFILHARPRGASSARHSLRPLNFRRLYVWQNSRGTRGEIAEPWVNYARRHCAHDNGIAGLHPSSREAVGSRRAKLALRVARSAGWGAFVSRWINPTRLAFGQPPSHRFAEGGIRKNELRSELCSSEPHAEEAQSPSRSMRPGRLRN
jgi:hypothetical protein